MTVMTAIQEAGPALNNNTSARMRSSDPNGVLRM
jgi:hypothetical protein